MQKLLFIILCFMMIFPACLFSQESGFDEVVKTVSQSTIAITQTPERPDNLSLTKEANSSESNIIWNNASGARWAFLKLESAPFPHPERMDGYTNSKGDYFPFSGHYDEGSAIVIIPDGFYKSEEGINLIVHFHGHRNNVRNVLQQFTLMPQLVASQKNALLILAQGPKDSPDSFGGKMEDPNGFRNFVEEILSILKNDAVITSIRMNKIVITGHSGGYRPIAFVLEVGGLTDKISEVYLFDAFYAEHDKIFNWITNYQGKLISIYTGHLSDEHNQFMERLKEHNIRFSTSIDDNRRLIFYPTDVCHNCVIENNFEKYLRMGTLKTIKP